MFTSVTRPPMSTEWLVKFVLSSLVGLAQRIKALLASYLRDVRRGRLHPNADTVP